MNRKERAQRIGQILDAYFPNPTIPLTHTDPYTLLIAVLLSAQCTDKRVNEVTPHLFARAAIPQAMVALGVDAIQAIIRPCGLSSAKAKAIVSLSEDLIAHHKSRVPQNFTALEALMGVGHKTASVVMAQAFAVPAFPIDTHIHRCAERWGLSTGKNVEKTERDLKRCFPKAAWIKRHLQIIYFARTFCPARGHRVEKCPICAELNKKQ